MSVPLLGYPVSYAKTTPGIILLIIIPAVIIIYDEIQKIRKEIANKIAYRKLAEKRFTPLNSAEGAPAEQDSTGGRKPSEIF